MRVITKSDGRAAGVQFVYLEYDYRPNWTDDTKSSATLTIQLNAIFGNSGEHSNGTVHPGGMLSEKGAFHLHKDF